MIISMDLSVSCVNRYFNLLKCAKTIMKCKITLFIKFCVIIKTLINC